MNVLTKPAEDAAAVVAELGRRARDAAVALRNASTDAKNRALGALIDGKARCSWFLPEGSPLSARKKWIKGSLKTAGALLVDDGAVRALSAGKSLLPAGVTAIEGEFKRGDVVDVKDRAGRVLARGLVAYAAEDARRIAGRKSAEIEHLLGFRGRDEMVHRDDLVVE